MLFADGRIEVCQGDITTLNVDVIVNAANAALCGGGGVDGAIHRAAGPGLLEECRGLGGAKTGEAKLTAGYDLPAKHVIHAVGPVWYEDTRDEPALLRACYSRSIALMQEHGLSTIAFPAISTGAYRFPLEPATRIALATVHECSTGVATFERAVFCCFSAGDLAVYERVGQQLFGS